MSNIKLGDIVARKSHGMDLYFKVVTFKDDAGKNVILKGISYRLQADAPESDLVPVPEERIREYKNQEMRRIDIKNRNISQTRGRITKKNFYRDVNSDSSFKIPGRVLHLDGDEEYLNTCLDEYKKFNVSVTGKHIAEKDQPSQIYKLLSDYRPDILVVTGHDGVTKGKENYGSINSYINSRYYIESVREARRFCPDKDSLVIFAGACQSMYREILNAGANYASSPKRILIHALDPVLVAERVANMGTDKILIPRTVISNTMTGSEGIGGIETRGQYREGYPTETY